MTLLQTVVTRLSVAAVLSNSAAPFSVEVLRIGWLLFEIQHGLQIDNQYCICLQDCSLILSGFQSSLEEQKDGYGLLVH